VAVVALAMEIAQACRSPAVSTDVQLAALACCAPAMSGAIR
jgi:hypothetical protein